MAVALGKYWSYITPEYLFYEIDVPALREYFALVPQEVGDWVYRERRRNDYSQLPKQVASVKEG